MAELQMLLDQEIPSGRKALIDSHNNLQKVASYCAQKYIDEPNKKVALEETKNFTTQSLASVAYQINTLANNMLQMLDIQSTQLADMDSAINNIAQTVDVHKEKVARREIGLLTTSKSITRAHQIVAPTNPDRAVKYVRKPIDYNELDDVGHGIKLNAQPNTGVSRRQSSAQSNKRSPSTSVDGGSKRDSLKSNVSSYGTLRAVKAPTVPQEYNQNSRRLPAMFHKRANSNSSSESAAHSTYSYSSEMNVPPPPSASGVPAPPPVASGVPAPPPAAGAPAPPPPPGVGGLPSPPPAPVDLPSQFAMSPQMSAPPPPPPPAAMPPAPDASGGYSTPNIGYNGKPAMAGGSAETYAATSVMDLPPPPPAQVVLSRNTHGGSTGRNPSLPMTGFTARMGGTNVVMPPPPPMNGDILPPPPMDFDGMFSSGDNPMSMEPDWAPKSFLEKMVVIYDYTADNEDELSLKEDQIVYVVKKNDDGWFEGVVNGITGLFPGNYAEKVSS